MHHNLQNRILFKTKVVSIYQIMWFDKKLRAMYDVQDPSTNMIGVRDLANARKQFAVFESHRSFVKYVGKQQRKHFYEHLGGIPYQPLAPYIDVDIKVPESTSDTECKRIVSIYKQQIRIFFEGFVDTKFDVLACNAFGTRDSKRIISFHIKIHGMDVYFRGMRRQRQFWTAQGPAFFEQIKPLLPSWVPSESISDVLDLSVYTERPWRMLGCSKITDPTRTLVPDEGWDAWDSDCVLKHMVSYPLRSDGPLSSLALGMHSFPYESIRNEFTPMMITAMIPRAISESWSIVHEDKVRIGPYPSSDHTPVLREFVNCQSDNWKAHLCADMDAESYERELMRRWEVVQNLPDSTMCVHATWNRTSACNYRIIDAGVALYFTDMMVKFADALYADVPLEYIYGDTHPLQVISMGSDYEGVLCLLEQHFGTERYHDLRGCIWIEQSQDRSSYRYTFPNVLVTRSLCDILQDLLDSIDAIVLKDTSLVYFGTANILVSDEPLRLPTESDVRPRILFNNHKRKRHKKSAQGSIAPVTEPFYSLLTPYRIVHACSTQRVATHFWPPNGPACYYNVPPEKWNDVEKAIIENWSSDKPCMLSYCYMGRPHALQLDIDACPCSLDTVATVCQDALRECLCDTDMPDVSYALEKSPDKKDKEGFSYGRLTFPFVVVDEEGSRKCKIVCAHACAQIHEATSFKSWVTNIIDPASRTARTHHSGKIPAPGTTDYRVSQIRAFVNSDGQPQTTQQLEWLCPLRTDDAMVLKHHNLLKMNGIVTECEKKIYGACSAQTGGRYNVNGKIDVMVRGKRIVCSGMSVAESSQTCERIYDAIQHTSYVKSVCKMGKTIDIVFVGYDRGSGTYFCRTNSKYCPWREETDYKILAMMGKSEGTSHNDNHIWIVIKKDSPRGKGNITLRCAAQWHTHNKQETKKKIKERDITPSNWKDVRERLFRILQKQNAARDMYKMCCT